MNGEIMGTDVALPDRPATDVSSAIPDYLAPHVAGWLASTKSPHTWRAYRTDLADWLTFCRLRDVDPFHATRDHGNLWLGALRQRPSRRTGRPPSEASLARKAASVASWYAYLRDKEPPPTTAAPVSGKNRPKAPKESTTTGLNLDEARAFLAAADREPPRNRAILHTLLAEGLRAAELARLTVGDLGYAEGAPVIHVEGKGRKDRTIVVDPAALTAIHAHLDDTAERQGITRDELDRDSLLFTASSGAPISQQQLYRMVRRVARAAGILSWASLSPHSLRHTCATLALDAGAALHAVQEHLGHTSPETTGRYDRARGKISRSPIWKLADQLAGRTPDAA